MNITNAQYIQNIDSNNIGVRCTIDGKTVDVPMDSDNRHFIEIQRQVAAGDLTIADAE